MMDYLGQKNVGYLGSVWNILVHLTNPDIAQEDISTSDRKI